MGLKKSLLSGIVAFAVATALVRAVGGKEVGTRVGLLTGSSVAFATLLSGRKQGTDVEIEGEVVAE